MLHDMRLNENGAFLGVKTSAEPVQENLATVVFDTARVGVIRHEGVPIDDTVIAVVIIL
jgi:hypothetical protein